jgi:AcrR family transcriptional regulator
MNKAKSRRAAVDLEAITTSALELFNQNGYDGTSMESIANSLSITKAALYYHAPGGKEQILEHAMRRVMDPLWLSLQEPSAVEGSGSERLRYVLTRQVELVVNGMPGIAYFLLPVAHHPLRAEVRSRRRAYDAAVRSLLESSLKAGEVRDDLDAAVMLRLILGMVYSINEWYRPGGRLNEAEIRDTVLAIVFRGINPQLGD